RPAGARRLGAWRARAVRTAATRARAGLTEAARRALPDRRPAHRRRADPAGHGVRHVSEAAAPAGDIGASRVWGTFRPLGWVAHRSGCLPATRNATPATDASGRRGPVREVAHCQRRLAPADRHHLRADETLAQLGLDSLDHRFRRNDGRAVELVHLF